MNNPAREALRLAIAEYVTQKTGIEHELEYAFAKDAGRKWRSDIAWPAAKVALEIDGGTWSYGRHNRASSVLKDMEKGNGYAERGWAVFHVPWEWIERGSRNRSAEVLEAIVKAVGREK